MNARAAQCGSRPQEQSDAHRINRIYSGMELHLGVEIDRTDADYRTQGWTALKSCK